MVSGGGGSDGFRGDTRDETWISLMVLFQEIHVADTLRLASVRSRYDISDWTKLLLDDVWSMEVDLQWVTQYR